MARILIADDAAFMRMILRNILTEAGHTIIAEAGDGVEAVRAFVDFSPDLATLDITMPNMGGIDALRAIIALHPNARIVMCSAMGQKSMVMESIQAGAKDFIVKPFQTKRVLTAVSAALR